MRRRAFATLAAGSLVLSVLASLLWLAGALVRPDSIELRRFTLEPLPDGNRGTSIGLSVFFGELFLSRTRDDWHGDGPVPASAGWSGGRRQFPFVLFGDEIWPTFNAYHRAQRRTIVSTGSHGAVEEWGLLMPLWSIVLLFSVLPGVWATVRYRARLRRP
jgi:hypothetical protein